MSAALSQPPFFSISAFSRFHLDRTAGGDRHYRDPGGHAPACVVPREREIKADLLLEQSQTNGPRHLFICGRLSGPASPAVLRPGSNSASGRALLQLSSFRLGWAGWQAGRGEARGEPGPSLHRQLPASARNFLLSKFTAAEVVQSRFREEVFRKPHSSLAHVRRRWPGQYDLQLFPTNGCACQKRERGESGLDASGPQADGIKLAAVDGDGPDLYLGHDGPYQWQESIRRQCAFWSWPCEIQHD